MRATDLKIAFFGTPRLAQIVLEKLIDSPYKPVLVVTALDTKAGRGQNLLPSLVKQTAVKNHIDVLQPINLHDKNFQFSLSTRNSLKASIFNFQFDLAILVAYGKIIPKNILSLPRYGFVNIHPSLLPKYRGPSPIQSAILAGEKVTGVSIIKLDEEIDHGPILSQESKVIKKNDTHASLIEQLGNIGVKLLAETLPKYLEGKLKPKSQIHTKATYTKRITKKDGLIDPLNPPNPQTLNRIIRAYYPWPGTWCRLMVNGKWLIVKFLPNSLKTQKPNSPFVIQPEGKRPMTIKEFLNGYPEAKRLLSKLGL